MAYKAEIIKDSISKNGNRITTFEVSFPRFVLAEFNTARMFSRNFSSSRAIPVTKMIESIRKDPVMPVFWGRNQPGMSANVELDITEQYEATRVWLRGLENAIETVENLVVLNLHKQIANRILEPWMWATGIVTATTYKNFFTLRCAPDAQPEIKRLADMMKYAYEHSTPDKLEVGHWHIPMITAAESDLYSTEEQAKMAIGRLARVSYLTHDGKRDIQKDIELFDKLLISKHFSPFEHVACNMNNRKHYGNFKGWEQYRKGIVGESGE